MNFIWVNVVGSLGLYSSGFLISMIIGDAVARSDRPVEQKLMTFRRGASIVFFGSIALRIWLPEYFNPSLIAGVFLPNTGFGTMLFYVISLLLFVILYVVVIQIPGFFFQRRVRGTTQSLKKNLAVGVPRFMLGVGQWMLLFIAFFSIQAFGLSPIPMLFAILASVTAILSLGYLISRGSVKWLGKPTDEPRSEVEQMVRGVADRAGVSVDRVFTIQSEEVKLANAYAHGGFTKSVGLTTFLLAHLEKAEVEAVVAHELGHIKHRHTLIRYVLSIAATTAALFAVDAVSLVAADPVFTYFLSLGAIILCVQFLPRIMYRKHEHQADAFAAGITGSGRPLALALIKISRLNHSSRPRTSFRFPNSTHPELKERLRNLVSAEELEEMLGDQ